MVLLQKLFLMAYWTLGACNYPFRKFWMLLGVIVCLNSMSELHGTHQCLHVQQLT